MKLSTSARKKVPKSEFGLPSQKKYPMPDKAHAANAKARASQMYKKGRLSKEQLQQISSKANKKLGKRITGNTRVFGD